MPTIVIENFNNGEIKETEFFKYETAANESSFILDYLHYKQIISPLGSIVANVSWCYYELCYYYDQASVIF